MGENAGSVCKDTQQGRASEDLNVLDRIIVRVHSTVVNLHWFGKQGCMVLPQFPRMAAESGDAPAGRRREQLSSSLPHEGPKSIL